MRRREFIVGAATMVAASRAVAQQPRAGKRLAIFSPSEPAALMNERSDNRYYRALFAELSRLGTLREKIFSSSGMAGSKTRPVLPPWWQR